jgi:Acyclic terpene utilisation family protein AtuA
MKTIRIGCGAGFAGDRIDPAIELAERGGISYLGFECLAERTIALAQHARKSDPGAGFDPLLVARFEAALPACARKGIKIITNMGAANPVSAARVVAGIARRLGLTGLKIAAVTGDDVLDVVVGSDLPLIERQGRVSDLNGIMSANAYLGVEPVIEALRGGANIVITGRVSDPALFAAPIIHELGWALDDWHRVGQSMLIGHLLECAGQISGGYFADPGYKSVANLARIGFPYADVAADGTASIGKVNSTGGEITVRTCKEQLLYEVHNPAAYLQPDVVADFSGVTFAQAGPDLVSVHGGTGRKRPDTLKVTIGYHDSFIGEGQMSYAGPSAAVRGQMALDIVKERLQIIGLNAHELRFDLIGVNAAHRGAAAGHGPEPDEVRIRVVGRTDTMQEAMRIGHEVESLWLNGPSGGGGAWKSAREVIAAASTLVPRNKIKTEVTYEVS